jgi:16S rRNA G966 N2-methylase RsmD
LIYIYIVNQARTIEEVDVVANLIKGMSEGFNFQRVPTITNDTLTVLEKSKYQKGEVSPDHHKVIICDNTIEKEHWEATQAKIEKLKEEKPDGYQDQISKLKQQQFILAPDNLDVLNNLLCDKTIKDHGGIDVIYIDPPYNTGDLNLGYRDVREQNE